MLNLLPSDNSSTSSFFSSFMHTITGSIIGSGSSLRSTLNIVAPPYSRLPLLFISSRCSVLVVYLFVKNSSFLWFFLLNSCLKFGFVHANTSHQFSVFSKVFTHLILNYPISSIPQPPYLVTPPQIISNLVIKRNILNCVPITILTKYS